MSSTMDGWDYRQAVNRGADLSALLPPTSSVWVVNCSALSTRPRKS